MKRSVFLGLLYLFGQQLCIPLAHAAQDLVLVTHIESPITNITAKQIRRLYFGIPVKIKGYPVVAARNTSDPLLYQMFLQKVIFLSSRDYERQIISRTFKRGGRMPGSISNLPSLIETVRSKHNTITFMWADSVAQYAHLKVIKVLWKGTSK